MALFDGYLKSLSSWMHLHPHWSGIITFTLAFCESLAIIGSIVPGSVTMTAVGILIGSRVISFPLTMLYAILGAIAGDGISFWIGNYFREGLKNIWPLKKYPLILIKGQEFFNKHGSKSIILGRFIGPMRSMIPLIAGMMQMPPYQFFAAVCVASCCWAIVYILPGIIIGAAAVDLTPKSATLLIIIVLLSLVVIWAISGLVKLIISYSIKVLNNNINAFWEWLRHHPTLHKFANFISDPSQPQSYGQLGRCILFSFSLLLFSLLCFFINHSALISHINNEIFYMLQSYRANHLDHFLIAITFLGESKVLFWVWLMTLIGLIYKRHWWTVLHWGANGILAAIAIVLIKHAIHFPRPSDITVIRTSGAFPSGHITFAIAILGFMTYLIASSLNRITRRFIYIPMFTILALIAISRIYLGAHWFSDFIGSLLLGASILLLTLISYRRRITPKLELVPLLILFLVSYVTAWGAFYYKYHHAAFYAYTPKYITTTISYNDWWNAKVALPLYRSNRLGNVAALLNVQWAAPLAQIKSTLLFNGWQLAQPSALINFINRIASPTSSQQLPVLPQLYNNQQPVLTVIKDLGSNKPRLMLNLWQSYYRFHDKDVPLWLGTVSYLMVWHPWHIKNNLAMQALAAPDSYLMPILSSFKVQKRQLTSNIVLMRDMMMQYHPTILVISTIK